MSLFSSTLISPAVTAALPSGYRLRPLQRTDHAAGFLDVLRVLTTVGDISESDWQAQYDWMAARSDEYFVIVIEEESTGKCVAVGSLIVERKL